ncbi:CBS domain-containing protein [Virgibacillus campisalis]|uniref:CBS domain-containing protein n=3 Tax=Virgibacillus alimentarius TaxID=698769 RepID=A0ABS4SBK0_9BACI|nr:CBS domain-containing protein [Virgibacillus alimentarius]
MFEEQIHHSEGKVSEFSEILGAIIYLGDPNKYFEDVKKSMGHFVKTVMTEKVISTSPNNEVDDAATLIVRNKIKRLPVLNNEDKIVGIVLRKDIMNYLFLHE